MQAALKALINENIDIFSYSVKRRSMEVPPMEFSIDTEVWEANLNRAASREISTEKQAALSALIDEQLEKEVIRPSIATAWSQVDLVWKPSGMALQDRLQGWQIPNMKEMQQHIGRLKPSVCGVADLTHLEWRILSNAATQGLSGRHRLL